MTLYPRLEVLDITDVLRATVGDIIATLREQGRQHALVVDTDPDSGKEAVRGIFAVADRPAASASKSPQAADDLRRIERADARLRPPAPATFPPIQPFGDGCHKRTGRREPALLPTLMPRRDPGGLKQHGPSHGSSIKQHPSTATD